MVKLLYASRARQDFGPDALRELLREARERNDRSEVTGMLLYAHGSFMQVLEGPADAVDETYDRIVADERHEGLRLLGRDPIDGRAFSDWSMGFEHPDDEELAEHLPGFKASSQYPLVNSELVHNGTVAETLLRLYARNA